MEKFILGSENMTSGDVLMPDNQVVSGFLATQRAIATKIRAYSRTSGEAKTSVYSGSSRYDNESDLKWADNNGKSFVSDQWNEVEITSPFEIMPGIWYHVSADVNDSNVITSHPTGSPLWASNSAPYASFVFPTSMGTFIVGSNNELTMAVYGWIQPSILSIDKTSFNQGDVITIEGTDFMPNNAVLYIADGSDFSSANKISQMVSYQNDEKITFSVDIMTLGGGSRYLFLVTEMDLVNEVGFEVNVSTEVLSFDWGFTTGKGVFLVQIDCAPILPGTLVILSRDGVNNKILSDDGSGALIGTGVGIVDYENGWVAFSFSGPRPAIGTQITADYDPVEGGCGTNCGKCLTHFVKLSVTPGQISGSDQFTLKDAWNRLFTKIERDILPAHNKILRELINEYYRVMIVYHFDIIPADEVNTDESGLHVKLDDTSW